MYEGLALLSLIVCLLGASRADTVIKRSGNVRKSIYIILVSAAPFLVAFYMATFPDGLLEAIGMYLAVSITFWGLAYFQFGGNSFSREDLAELWKLLKKKKVD